MSLTNKIFLSLTLGLVLGSAANFLDLGSNIYLIDFIEVPGELFISSLKMLVVPVVFFFNSLWSIKFE